jgi:hypothetical protein
LRGLPYNLKLFRENSNLFLTRKHFNEKKDELKKEKGKKNKSKSNDTENNAHTNHQNNTQQQHHQQAAQSNNNVNTTGTDTQLNAAHINANVAADSAHLILTTIGTNEKKELPPVNLENGAVYVGQWKNGMRDGVGVQNWPDG